MGRTMEHGMVSYFHWLLALVSGAISQEGGGNSNRKE